MDTSGVLPQGASQRGQHLRNRADTGGTDSRRQTAGSGGGSGGGGSGGGGSRDGTGRAALPDDPLCYRQASQCTIAHLAGPSGGSRTAVPLAIGSLLPQPARNPVQHRSRSHGLHIGEGGLHAAAKGMLALLNMCAPIKGRPSFNGRKEPAEKV